MCYSTIYTSASDVQHGFYARPSAHLRSLATGVGLGRITHSSDIARFVQGGVVKTFRCATYPGIYGTTPLAKRTQRICDANIDWLFGAVLLGRLARLDIRIHAADVRPILGVRILRMVLRRLFGVGGDRTTWREQRAPSAMPNMFRTVGDPACPAMSDLRRRLARGY